ncbi:biotin-independent malonate decarboxylase subunit gamma [Janthinobacterium agaricidamnosum]|uniref:Malonate decarboxylase, gamma subunit n=1 Tax=Janthinobacterium agaricidamnosum NBRC 102515 = DSM 9628 TaxID=1349767 RepID=W0V3F6_9BURK|nr:biotin-independent malonate decarboxylase subunit gamma [Janthinobacterium agaricidamnosum]CDG83364.1 malonate decarboxylase, gamma subunit [Janthinobacterium agaricidamnosum NBRC 102515 = DSM 9628]
MSQQNQQNQQAESRGARWLALLAGSAPLAGGYGAALRVADASLAGRPARYIAVVPDWNNRFPRARNGEIGLVEGWLLARAVQQVIALDRAAAVKRPIVALIDVTSQAYGRREEAYGIHQALAGAAGAYAEARLAGHPVIGLIVGLAMSGAFLAHGYQANRLIAFDDPGVMVHAMGKASAARITLRSVAALETLAASVPPMAYDIRSYASLGLLWRVLAPSDADRPLDSDVALVRQTLEDALADILADPRQDLAGRLDGEHRAASRKVRQMLRQQW